MVGSHWRSLGSGADRQVDRQTDRSRPDESRDTRKRAPPGPSGSRYGAFFSLCLSVLKLLG